MNRRIFLNTLAATSAGLVFFSQVTRAQMAPSPTDPIPVEPSKPALVRLEILNNHGHEGAITYEAVIVGQAISIDIQGDSRHPHTLILTEEELTVLRQKLTVDVISTVDAGHSHMVRITRDPITN
jgi:hypothetical protein